MVGEGDGACGGGVGVFDAFAEVVGATAVGDLDHDGRFGFGGGFEDGVDGAGAGGGKEGGGGVSGGRCHGAVERTQLEMEFGVGSGGLGTLVAVRGGCLIDLGLVVGVCIMSHRSGDSKSWDPNLATRPQFRGLTSCSLLRG